MLNDFRVKFSEFKTLNDEVILNFIDEAKLQINPKIWGRFYESGVLYLTAHILATQGYLSQNLSDLNPIKDVTNKSVGSLSVGYLSSKNGFENESGNYHLTKYGRRFLELKKLVAPHFGVIR
ncbi:DUF4054 domain-containing protein [Campylobacter mucosalis]|uniref:DUF4054 domain-containing protein n=1 Tax=Campylobacter mucosalis TaxID=202 RepID=UPI00147077D8|nr:DUF4054 domain-containing protein [Campylobacter mucosalis]